MLLDTDSLVERRSESLTEALDRLLRVVATHRDDTAAALVGGVVRALHDTCARRRRLRARGPRARVPATGA